MKNVIATLAGLMVAAIITFGIESLSSSIFPLPDGADPTNMEWLKNNIDLIPTGAMILVAFAHFIGIVIGMLVAGLISRTSLIPAYIVGVLMLAGTIANLVMIPHPTWFMVVDILGVLVGICIGKSVAAKKINASDKQVIEQ
ncbi:MAG: hypothetical protein KJP20_04925 [Bacteroidia bacterium]|nr:hypothetical protein [Bacteroidia bacterium]NNL32407.1 hypothetical protein [Flavobacteriaceae bacterium]RZW50063.1 MAG: hypothetical protein EX263_07740 [Flavobacteriaceae bacterium]